MKSMPPCPPTFLATSPATFQNGWRYFSRTASVAAGSMYWCAFPSPVFSSSATRNSG